MPNLLTLAISESKPEKGEYKIVAMDIEDNKFYSMDLKMDEFFKNNQILWDLGAVTYVESLNIVSDYKNNLLHRPEGSIKFKRYYSRQELKDYFDRNLINLDKFYHSQDIAYGIVRIDYLDEILEPSNNEVFKQYINITAQGYEKKWVLIKDYRWLHYWRHIYEQNRVKEKIKYFKGLIKENTNHNVYLIMYRHNFSNSPGRWIVGFHWL